MSVTILHGDCIEQMRTLPDRCVHCCVTSPPYFGLRDYGHAGQIGLEPTPDAYVAKMVEVFREVRRVLRDDGTLWLNLGDSYASTSAITPHRGERASRDQTAMNVPAKGLGGLKPKDIIGIPWRVAFALQADGWWLRQDIIWHKPNPMPESVRDRCTKAHEYLFLLAKSERYYYDAVAIAEQATTGTWDVMPPIGGVKHADAVGGTYSGNTPAGKGTRNRRSVWSISPKPYSGAHFAVMPAALVEPCILAGCPVGGTVLDPFGGSGTTAAVAIEHGRNAVLCELNEQYIELARRRIAAVQPRLFAAGQEVQP